MIPIHHSHTESFWNFSCLCSMQQGKHMAMLLCRGQQKRSF